MANDKLKKQWTVMYGTTLPTLARKKDPVQQKWPVHVDHCFGRIILDNAIGEDRPWMKVLKAPAVHNVLCLRPDNFAADRVQMTDKQLRAAIKMGQDIVDGKVNLVALNSRSLELRGKKQKESKARDGPESKKKSLSRSDPDPEYTSEGETGKNGGSEEQSVKEDVPAEAPAEKEPTEYTKAKKKRVFQARANAKAKN